MVSTGQARASRGSPRNEGSVDRCRTRRLGPPSRSRRTSPPPARDWPRPWTRWSTGHTRRTWPSGRSSRPRPRSSTSAASCGPRRSSRSAGPPSGGSPVTPRKKLSDDKLPIRMLHDRVLVSIEKEGERKSSAGILIPATAQMGRRLAWAKVFAIGANVRTVEVDDRVLFDPEDRAEVEVRGDDYILLRERDLHAVAAGRLEDGQTGL